MKNNIFKSFLFDYFWLLISSCILGMAVASQITYPGICFSNGHLSQQTKFEITKDGVWIFDPTDGYRFRFTGDTSKYSITITDSGTKKRPYKNIIIKRLMPLCPLSGLPVIESDMAHIIGCSVYESSPDRGIQFTQGFAYNCYQVNMWKHQRFELHPTLYNRIGVDRVHACDIYLVVPIVDGRKMKTEQKDALFDYIGNMDVVNIISSYYNELSNKDENFNFHMEDTPIKTDTLYHKSALVELFKQGKLKLGITADYLIGLYGYSNSSILILEPDAYNYVSFYGKESYLKKLFINCEQMMNFRKNLFEKYLV